jgi:hypothetical protein
VLAEAVAQTKGTDHNNLADYIRSHTFKTMVGDIAFGKDGEWDRAIKSLCLTQRVAARRIGTTQPELSKIPGGKFTEVSLERLMRFLTALGYRIEIKIGARNANRVGAVTIKDTSRTAA